MTGAGAKSHQFQGLGGSLTTLAPAGAADVQGKFHVLEGGKQGNQAEGLEDEGDAGAAQVHKLGLGELAQVAALENDAALIGLVQTGQQV